MKISGRPSKQTKAFCEVALVLNNDLSDLFFRVPDEIKEKVQEIRLRIGCPPMICCAKESFFLDSKGNITDQVMSNCKCLDKENIEENFKRICNYSLYSHQEEIASGYITIKGGCRVGVCGTAVVENGKISAMHNISSLNIRIAKQSFKCADKVLEELLNNDQEEILGTLIVGEPACGKTTLLRDLARQISTGTKSRRKNVTIIDERFEIAGILEENWQNNVGLCDILSNISKGAGMLRAIRSLSPEILICDEIGGSEDVCHVKQILNSGVKLISSIHSGSLEELLNKESARELLKTGAFENIVIMRGRETPGEVEKIYRVSDKNVEIFRNDDANILHVLDGISGVS
ncbi:MAG: stage III sporulation protein AA [Oscillospiraceae bacterium]|nr:stage III sporulation protein AA [Oscillospiraceae bacterium]